MDKLLAALDRYVTAREAYVFVDAVPARTNATDGGVEHQRLAAAYGDADDALVAAYLAYKRDLDAAGV